MNTSLILATIIVNYKSEHRTITYVKEELLLKCTVPQIIVIVNNGATEESSNILCNSLNAVLINDIKASIFESKIYVIHNNENTGFAKGNNLGVDFISEHFNVKYLLFSNNDIRFIDSNVVEVLIEKLESLPDVGVIGPKVVGLDGNDQNPYVFKSFWNEILWMSWGRFIPFWHLKKFDRTKAQEGYYYRLMGSFFIVPYVSYIRCGKMDPNTFLYAEEVILAERMLKIGMKNYYLPEVSVLHEHGQTTTKYLRKGNNILLDSILYYFKEYKNISVINLFIGKILVQTYSTVQFFFRNIKR